MQNWTSTICRSIALRLLLPAFMLTPALPFSVYAQAQRWSTDQAATWQEKSKWLVGANYTPAYAINQLLPKAFTWARQVGATQPLTAGVWLGGHKAKPSQLNAIEKVQLNQSDVISFHCYGGLDDVKAWVENLRPLGRPLICTEYMARPNGSEFDPILGYFAEQKIGAHNWGFVAGKSNTIDPWDSWQKPYTSEPPVWFHDIFRQDGTAYRQAEVDYIRKVTGAAAKE